MSTNLKGTHLALLRLEVATFESHGPGWLARSDIIALVRVPLPIDEVVFFDVEVLEGDVEHRLHGASIGPAEIRAACSLRRVGTDRKQPVYLLDLLAARIRPDALFFALESLFRRPH